MFVPLSILDAQTAILEWLRSLGHPIDDKIVK